MTTKCLHQTGGKQRKNFVYLLTFPSGKSYVGVSSNPQRRLKEHWSRAQEGTYALSYALKKYGEPQLRILAETHTKEEAFALEIKFIAEMKTLAPNGYNMTKGGEGVALTQEQYKEQGQRYSEMLKTNPKAKNRQMRAAQKAGPKVSKANKAFYATPAGQQTLKNRTNSPWLKNVTAANQKPKTASQKAALSATAKENWLDADYRNKVNQAREKAQTELRFSNQDWVRKKSQKMSNSMKEKWIDPLYQAKMKARPAPVLSAESRAKAQAKQKQFWTEEQRAIASERTRLYWEKRRKQKSEQSQDH